MSRHVSCTMCIERRAAAFRVPHPEIGLDSNEPHGTERNRVSISAAQQLLSGTGRRDATPKRRSTALHRTLRLTSFRVALPARQWAAAEVVRGRAAGVEHVAAHA